MYKKLTGSVYRPLGEVKFIMVALRSRCGPHIFCPVISIFLSFFYLFPRLLSAVGDWMSTILPHMVWP